jgi:branched-chain amino acid transport system ATP-binding protein
MAQTLLRVEGLVKRFGGLTATDHASLAVRTGELHAVIGPNGAGKTTLIHQIAGALPSDAGRILLDDADITHLPMHGRVRKGLARSYQITNVFQSLSVLDNLALAVAARDGAMRFWHPARLEQRRLEAAAAVALQVELQTQLDTPAGALSHGEQRQLEVGLALATQPKLLLLDEPMAGMGTDESERMVTLLQSLRTRCTILLVEHDMDAVFRLADTISTLVAGKVIASGTPEFIRQHPEVRKAYLGDEVMEPSA